MMIRLHPRARTTPAVRQELQESTQGSRALAQQYGLARATVQKWRRRESVEDASHRPHTLHTTLTPAQEAIVVYLRQQLLVPLDDLLAVTREFLNPSVSRSGLDRCLRRHGVANLKALPPTPAAIPHKPFKAYAPGFLHVDVKYLPAIQGEARQFLFVAIDRATRWVYVALKPNRTAPSAKAFLKAVIAAAPFRIQKCLTDNGSEFTDRFLVKAKQPTGTHVFDQACAEHTIEHRLIPPRKPQTNGMVERFNGRIARGAANPSLRLYLRPGDHLAALRRPLQSPHSAASTQPPNAGPSLETMASVTPRSLSQSGLSPPGT
jgi:transposase InsO family protein